METTCFDQHWPFSGVSKIVDEIAVLPSAWDVPSSTRPRVLCGGGLLLFCRVQCMSSDIVDVFTDRYQAMYVPSRDLCIATLLNVTVFYIPVAFWGFINLLGLH
jgi:hypothetical protein